MDTVNQTLNIAESFEEIIKPELDRRVHLVASSVIGSFLSGDDPRTISFRHVLNRVMVLTQMPMCFVMFEDKAGKYVSGTSFNHSSQAASQIAECIAIIKNGNEKSLFKLFGTNSYLLAIIVGKKKGGHKFDILHNIAEKSTPTTTEHLAAYQLRKVLSKNQYASYGEVFHTTILQPCLRRAFQTTKRTKKNTSKSKLNNADWAEVIEDAKKRFDERLLRNKDAGVVTGMREHGYLDRIFKKIRKNLNEVASMSAVAENSQKLPANYVLFLRDYTKGHEYTRHYGLCDYSIRIALCDRQEKEFNDRFATLYKSLNSSPNEALQQYSKTFDRNYANDGLQSLAIDLDREFWHLLQVKSEQGTNFKYFSTIIGGYFGDHSRSVADAVFSDGVLFFRRPFADGGLGRCFSENEKEYPKTLLEVIENPTKWGNIADDLVRLVIGFYWYQGMVSSGKDSNYELGIMLSPVEIGNRISCVVGYFTSLYKVKSDSGREESSLATLNLEANTSAWNNNFHIFQEVSVRVKRELRHSMTNCYEDMAADYYAQISDPSNWPRMYRGATDPERMRERLADWVNLRFHALTTLFSYDEINIAVRDGSGAPQVVDSNANNAALAAFGPVTVNGAPRSADQIMKAGIYLSRSTHCAILSGVGNSFFPDAPTSIVGNNQPSYNFVNERDVQVKLTSAFIQNMWQEALWKAEDARANIPR